MSEPFGPFRSDMNPVERRAQLRVLRTLAHVHFALPELERALHTAESTDSAESLASALKLLDVVPAKKRRRILSTFAYLHRPIYNESPGRALPQEASNGTT